MPPNAGCSVMALEGTISAEAATEGVKLDGRTLLRIAPFMGVREGRRGTRVVNVLMRSAIVFDRDMSKAVPGRLSQRLGQDGAREARD